MSVLLEKTMTGCDVEKAFHEDMPKSINVVLLNYKDIVPHGSPTKITIGMNGS